MSKILRVKAMLTVSGVNTHYNYPPEYDAEKIKVLCYEHVGDKAAIVARGQTFEWLIGVVSDEDAPNFLKSDNITEMTQQQAIVSGRKWRPQVEVITDQGRVLSILAKSVRGETLTQEDIDGIDPENVAKGIRKSQLFDDLLQENL